MTKAAKIPRGPTTYVSKFAPGFMLQIDFAFFNVESIRVFTSTFVDICSATSHPFGFPSRSKLTPLDILKFLVTIFSNQNKKVALIQVDKDGALARYYEFMRTCHNINIIFQATGGDEYSLIGRSESTNNTLANITRTLLLNSSNKNELWCFAYQYSIWIPAKLRRY